MESLEESAAEYRFSNCLSAPCRPSEKTFSCTEEALHHPEGIQSFSSLLSTSFEPDCNMQVSKAGAQFIGGGVKR